ncbi:serine carboxypeptidase-like 11 [Humulus lupulus]|uniref:serine carboxypeptidase-like 11 n=1 Tax=Humulus lupulus TaxID=3486 RepID=UPI002B40AC31|nr:serine carboxypeptidase-like 11 [Humulus lupulus]
MSKIALLLVLLVVLRSVEVEVYAASVVKYLPGFRGRPLPFHLETGYIGVGESENVQLFYYFVKSERNPKEDPLLIWLTGGPGCSSWSGFAYEIGPINYKIEPYNGSLPTLVLNPYSWSKISNIIFVDSPVKAGFSYSKTSLAYQIGDFIQVDHLVEFFKKWLVNHREFKSNSLFVVGDSYSGKIVPLLTQQISNGIVEGTLRPIDLKGYILGNPVTDPSSDNYRIPFARGMSLISYELYKSLEKSCGGEYRDIDPSNSKCLKAFQTYEECTSGIFMKQILEPNCNKSFTKPQNNNKIRSERRRWLHSDTPIPEFGCREYDYLLASYWANDNSVRQALHIHKASIGEWNRCNAYIRNHYTYDVYSAVMYHQNLSIRGYRSLIYSGDHDMVIPSMSTEAWIRSLNYSIVQDWRPWIVEGEVAGYTMSYSNKMTYATVKGAGHTAPQYKPKECFSMFERWINYETL